MSKPIKKGDLVMVVRGCPHCGASESLGTVFRVAWMDLLDLPSDCCPTAISELCADGDANGNYAWQVSRLTRIDPPDLQTDSETAKELTA